MPCRRIAATEIVYADSSALVKLILAEPESAAAAAAVRSAQLVATSWIALVEIAHAVNRADPGADGLSDADALLAAFLVFDVDEAILRRASMLVRNVGSLDAIHLATAVTADISSMLVYDRRLADAAGAAGLTILSPA